MSRNCFIWWKLKSKWMLPFVLITACVKPVDFDVPPAQFLTIVEGLISDGPGPYTVKVSRSIGLDADSTGRIPVRNLNMQLLDDEGQIETLTEESPGEYVTGGIITGKVGHAYHIRWTTPDGKEFESSPERIHPVGQVESIKYQFEARTKETNYGVIDDNIFNVYVDANGGEGDNQLVRWRFTGIYKSVTNPELHETFSEGFYYMTPLPCSGFVVEPGLGGGKLTQVAPCECCTCWIYQYESIPHLSDGQLVNDNVYRNVKVGEVPVNSSTFADKYVAFVEQMSLSRNAFDFFKLIRAQKEGASSLFQPPSGEIVGNIVAKNSNDPVVGLFWATSITNKYTFIQRSDVPYLLPPPETTPYACTVFANSTTNKPDFWQ